MIKWLLGIPPKVGSKWCFRDEAKNPFNRDKWTVKVDEVREGWVKYHYLWYETSTAFKNSFDSSPIRVFRLIYKEVK